MCCSCKFFVLENPTASTQHQLEMEKASPKIAPPTFLTNFREQSSHSYSCSSCQVRLVSKNYSTTEGQQKIGWREFVYKHKHSENYMAISVEDGSYGIRDPTFSIRVHVS